MSNLQPDSRKNVRWPWWMRGGFATLGVALPWAGRFCGPLLRRFRTPERYAHGLIIVLPGIESESFLNHSIVWGLSDAGWPGAMEVDDWTTSHVVFFVYHLRGWQRNLRQAARIAARIVAYQNQYPGQPVHLIGHSGGGALAVLILEALPADRRITTAVLLGPAIAPRYPLQSALSRVERGIWNFWSPLDCFFLGAGTLLLGTLDGRISCSAGMIGFRKPAKLSAAEELAYDQTLHQHRYAFRMARTFNLGGHFGYTNRLFVETWIAPLLKGEANESR